MSRNGVDIGTSISTRPWANHRSGTLTQQSYEHIKSNLADSSCAILFIIGFRRAGIENWVKYAILCVRMSLWLCFFASENQAFLAPYWRAFRPWTGSVQGPAGAGEERRWTKWQFGPSLRSKRFQSSYCAKVRAGTKKNGRGKGREKRKRLPANRTILENALWYFTVGFICKFDSSPR